MVQLYINGETQIKKQDGFEEMSKWEKKWELQSIEEALNTLCVFFELESEDKISSVKFIHIMIRNKA